jgi:hypothetical protein
VTATAAPVRADRPPEPGAARDAPVASVAATAAAALLGVAAAAWLGGALFGGARPVVVALAGGLLGVGLVVASYRVRHASLVQYLVLPAAVAAGAAVAVIDSGADVGELPQLAVDAVRLGGLGQPPVPFGPGWQLVVVVLMACLGAATTAVAVTANRPALGVFVPAPLVFAVALLQPAEGSLWAGGTALLLLVAGLLVAHGAELARRGATTGRFELRRLARGAALLAVLAGAVVGLNAVGFLFPQPREAPALPAQQPESQPADSDEVLFTVRADDAADTDEAGPWRVGTFDVYDDHQWLLPPADSRRRRELEPDGAVPDDDVAGGASRTATFVLAGFDRRHVPHLPNPQAVTDTEATVAYDPRTQALWLGEPHPTGVSYTVRAPAPPSDDELADAPPLPDPLPETLERYVQAPAPPAAVETVLADAPAGSPWQRFQHLRQALYDEVTLAGPGEVVEVAPARVVELLDGGQASPFELAAAETLLARWAGLPARIGFGFLGGAPTGDRPDEVEVRGEHAANWVELHVPGQGWVPAIGSPERVKETLGDSSGGSPGGSSGGSSPGQSTSEDGSGSDGSSATALGLTVYVPVGLDSPRLFYETVRYWLMMATPMVAALALLWVFYPAGVKVARRARRRRWAHQRGLAERIAVSYAELRDAARDLNVGEAGATPLSFVGQVEADAEHAELAWLVTRALWGDLRRDLRVEDADAAEELAASVRRRLRKAQSALTVALAVAGRTSLREPYTHHVPNLWPRRRPTRRRRVARRPAGAPPRVGRRRGHRLGTWWG